MSMHLLCLLLTLASAEVVCEDCDSTSLLAASPVHRSLLAASSSRQLAIQNKCARPMVVQVTGGNTLTDCSEEACPTGLTCSPRELTCYFDFDEPAGGWTIEPGAWMNLSTPDNATSFEDSGGNVVTVDWSGKLSFFANTSDGGLPPASFCNNAARCPTYEGLVGVATALEFTLSPHLPDYYDVSIINGYNIGIEMKPDGSFDPVSDAAAGSFKGYNCGAAGASYQPNPNLSSCSWTFNYSVLGSLFFNHEPLSVDNHKPLSVDISPLLVQVDGGYGECTSTAHCASGLVCGQVAISVENAETGFLQPTTDISMECGHQIGTWSAWQLCVWSGNNYVSPAPFTGFINCSADADMYGCDGSEPWTTTCYSADGEPIDGPCCGCADWTEVLQEPVPDNGEGCMGSSQKWMTEALPYLTVLKESCPTSYTYAFDDESSTFTCQTAESRADPNVANDAGYVITLCPSQPS
eukprot:CAMPEP_0197655448 /NCGR_PEP_ID=MMETSP1338-20131121/39458_1 /TAXON_ID=43686 ORGANISM="Pelagodinium beii, Strain RCC1491" /NCGR_SAMPLE_ID=MMETSP1338 /ASSEMBLY_ACC=CAM_ASM_000754 /LENGTH=465 /DNA_ID=CAMNT_0043231097 /DNA_START=50 /DNA_END=1447 /DNA_ORIENTATION=+